MVEDNGVRGWSNDIRVENRRFVNSSNSRWLKEEGGGKARVSENNMKHATETDAEGVEFMGQSTPMGAPRDSIVRENTQKNLGEIML